MAASLVLSGCAQAVVAAAAATPASVAATAPASATAENAAPDAERAMARLKELRREIARHDELYFRKAAPIISDFEYDRLKAELRTLEANMAGFEQTVGAAEGAAAVGDDRTGNFATRRHREPMLSLAKAHSDEEVAAFVARVEAKLGRGAATFRVEPKYDGLAVSLTY